MEHQILGTTMPVLSVSLSGGESVVAEVGEFSWMTDSIQMSTGIGGGGGGQGLMGALKRKSGGGTLLMSTYTAQGAPGVIAFASKMPGSILPIEVGSGHEYMAHRHGFLAGTPGIQISAGFQQSFSAGVFGGDGFILQRIGGQGQAWVELAGEVVRYELAPGQSLRVHPGQVGMSKHQLRSRSSGFRASPTGISAGTHITSACCRDRARSGCSRCRCRSWLRRWHRSSVPRRAAVRRPSKAGSSAGSSVTC